MRDAGGEQQVSAALENVADVMLDLGINGVPVAARRTAGLLMAAEKFQQVMIPRDEVVTMLEDVLHRKKHVVDVADIQEVIDKIRPRR